MRISILVSSLVFIGSFQSADAQWSPKSSGDCGGMDVGCSAGSTPIRSRCVPGGVARSAVCWDSRRGGDPPNFRANNCSASGSWCTYKSVGADQCVGGGAPGAKYDCTPGPQQPIQGAQIGVYHINPVRDAKTPYETVNDCLGDNVCSVIVSAVAAEIGIPPNVIRMANAARFVSDALQHPGSEETRYSIAPPQGYRICRVNIRT